MKSYNTLIFFFFLLLPSRAQDKKWTLDECLQYAWQHNVNVLQAKLQERSSHQDVTQAIGNFLPNIDLNLSLNEEPLKSAVQRDAFLTLKSYIVLFDGMKNLRTLSKAKIDRDKAQQMTDRAKLKLALDVTESFVNILYNKDSLRASEEQLTLSKKYLEQVKKKYKLGGIAKGDVITAEVQLASEEKNRIEAQNNLSMSKIKLAALLQLDDIKGFNVSDKNFVTEVLKPISIDPEELVEKTLQSGPELKIAKLTWKNSKKQEQIVRGNYWPHASLYYSFDLGSLLTNLLSKNYFDRPRNSQSNKFMIEIKFLLFERLATKTSVEKAKINQEIALLEMEKTKNQLKQTIYQIYTAAQGAYAVHKSAQKEEEAAKLSFEYTQKRYHEGMATPYDFNNAKNQWMQAQHKTIRTKYIYILKTKTLSFYTTELPNR